MPTYAYQCQACGDMQDAQRRIAERDEAPAACQKCGQPAMKRMFSNGTAPLVRLVGADWHDTNYSKTGRRKGM